MPISAYRLPIPCLWRGENVYSLPMASKFGRPATRGSFKPGHAPVTPGRPKVRRDVEALARQDTPEAIEALRAALKVPRERVAAAQVLLDRGWGKPAQSLAIGAQDSQNRVTAVQLTVISAPAESDSLEGPARTPPPPNGVRIFDGETGEKSDSGNDRNSPGVIHIDTIPPETDDE